MKNFFNCFRNMRKHNDTAATAEAVTTPDAGMTCKEVVSACGEIMEFLAGTDGQALSTRQRQALVTARKALYEKVKTFSYEGHWHPEDQTPDIGVWVVGKTEEGELFVTRFTDTWRGFRETADPRFVPVKWADPDMIR